MPSQSTPVVMTLSVMALAYLDAVSASPLPLIPPNTVDNTGMPANATAVIRSPQASTVRAPGDGAASGAATEGKPHYDANKNAGTALVILICVWVCVVWLFFTIGQQRDRSARREYRQTVKDSSRRGGESEA
ncbi:hypothetical protein B0T20DRAFT_198367 [Sordaria brevicollis]|uniref:Transmembrane protein n=1 Tax=Sordaria brevicollis TaxID=83679 RepID=A0AAE0PGG0_SORBR|nr:hypothetical protein B0T20DRAFT_198367 [Sordaria brevicollis]